MKNITNPIRVGRVRRTSISSNLVEDQSSSILRQQTNHDSLIKQNTSRRISRSAPLRDELQDQKQTSTIKTSVNNRPNDGTNNVKMNDQKRLKAPISPSPPPSSLPQTQTTPTRNLDEIASKSAWSLKKKIIVGVSATAVAAALITVATVLGVLLTRSTATTNTTTTTVSSTVISAYWSFDNTIADRYGVYNGQLMNGAGFSPNTSNQPYVGYGQALYVNSSMNQSFIISTSFLDLTFKSFTIEAWIYPTILSTDRGIFGQCQCATCSNQCLFFIIRATHLYIGFTSNDLSGTTILSAGTTWYHVAFVYNYQTQQQILYINGAQEAIKSNAQPYQGKNASTQIGSTQVSSGTDVFNGYIDNVMVTTRAKSASEILSDASLMAYYSFDLPNPTIDNGPNGLNGTSLNTQIGLGRVNNAMRFTGTSSYFQSYGFYQFPYGVINNKPFSVSLWINPSSNSSSTIVQMFATTISTASCTNFLGTYSATGINAQITVVGYPSQPVMTGPFVTSNTWTHISITYSSINGYSLYVNGIIYGNTGYLASSLSNTLAYLFIGYYSNCNNGGTNIAYTGSVDEAYIHNRELTQSDVTTLANP